MDIALTIAYLLPALVLGTLLAAATLSDVLTHRVSNQLCLLLLVSGLACQYAVHGGAGVVSGTAGVGTGALLLLPFYAMGGMAAGDVKLLGASASYLGPVAAVVASLATLFIGALIAICLVALHALHRLHASGPRRPAETVTTSTGPDATGPVRFPYALAITPGVVAGALTGDSLIAQLLVPGGFR